MKSMWYFKITENGKQKPLGIMEFGQDIMNLNDFVTKGQ